MRASLRFLPSLLLVLLPAVAFAQCGPYPCMVRRAPDAMGPGFYVYNPCDTCNGCWHGPYYCVYPPWGPFNGFRPCKGSGGGGPQQASMGPAAGMYGGVAPNPGYGQFQGMAPSAGMFGNQGGNPGYGQNLGMNPGAGEGLGQNPWNWPPPGYGQHPGMGPTARMPEGMGQPPGMQGNNVPPGGHPLGYGSPQDWAYPQACGLPPGAFSAGFNQPPPAPGILAFPTHPFARSPRDFFMTETK